MQENKLISKSRIKIYAVFVFIALSLCKLNVHAADIASGTSGTCTWVISEDGTFSIYPTDGKSGTLDEPTSYGSSSVKWPWQDYKKQITSINIKQGTVYAPQNCKEMFAWMENATQMDISALNTSRATDMTSMFSNCYKITQFNLAHFDVSNVLYFNYMFGWCYAAENIDIHGWDMTKNTSYVYDSNQTSLDSKDYQVYEMFDYAGNKAKSLCINANNVKFPRNCYWMFASSYASKLCMEDVDFSEVYNFSYFLSSAWQNLKELTITNIGTMEHVGSMNRMFADHNYNSQLQSLTLKGFSNAEAVTDVGYMFREQGNLTSLNSDLTTGNQLVNIAYIFTGCDYLEYFDLTGLDVSNSNFSNTSLGINSTKVNSYTVDISGWDMSNWTKSSAKLGSQMMSSLGGGTIIANDIKLPKNSTYNWLVQIYAPFYGPGTNKIIAHNVDFSGIQALSNFFSSSNYSSNSKQPKKIDFTAINTDGIKNLDYGFYNSDNNIYQLDLTWIKNAKIESMACTFFAPLQYVDLSTLDTTGVTDSAMTQAFSNCADTIETIVLGEKTVLRATAGLPTARWVCQETGEALSTDDLITKTQGEGGAPGTWRIAGRQSYISITDNVYDVLAHSNYTESTDDNGNTIKIPGSVKDGEDPVSLYTDLNNGGGYWQKLSNDLWAYHFFVFDNNTVWKIWEDPVTGYTSSNSADNPIEINGDEVAELKPTITNTKTKRISKGQLSLKKIAMDTDGTTEITPDKSFAFTITLSGDNISGSQIFGTTAFTDGKAAVSLSAGETITFTDIPVNTKYSIEEKDTAGFTGVIDNPTGTISETETSVTCTNTKTEEAKKETSSFTVSKVVSSNADETDTEFAFHAILAGLLPNETYSLSNGKTYQANASGDADVSFALKDKESIKFLNIPVGCTYLIMEEAGDYISSYKITDKNGIGKIVSSYKKLSSANKDLSTEWETLDKGEDVTVQFTNKITRVENVTLTKVSLDSKGQVDTKDNTRYSVDVCISGLEEEEKIYTSNGILIADSDGVIETLLYISPTEKVIFYDLPVGTKYKFSEEANDKIGSFTITNGTTKGTIAKETAANKDAKKDISTAEETVDAGEDITVTFTNTSPKSAKLQVIKYDNSTSKKKIGGAEFALYKSDGTAVNFTKDGTNIIKINDNGSSDVLESQLFIEGQYYLEETKAPDGYLMSEPKSFTISATDVGKILQIEVYDDKIIVLPVTGGEGRDKYISFVCILMAMSISLVIYKKRRAY